MKYTGVLLASLLVFSMAIASAAAQGLDAEQVAGSLSPLKALIEGVTRLSWDMTKLFVGMDESSIAYFAYELGFRGDEVYLNDISTDAGTRDCSVGSIRNNETTGKITASCTPNADTTEVSDPAFTTVTLSTTLDQVDDADGDNVEGTTADIFHYYTRNLDKRVMVSNGAKGQIMLFALIIPLGMLFFLLNDFFISTGLLRTATAGVLSLGVSLLAARSGVYTALLGMVSDIFGAGGFFLSMLSIYLTLAVLMWFYGGILKSKAIAEKDQEVADAVVDAFTADIRRGTAMKEAAKSLTKNK